jgi:hypothetical protein
MKRLLFISFLYLFYIQNAVTAQDQFKLCDGVRTMPYYHPDITNALNFYDIKKHFRADYPEAKFKKLSSNSGLITIQFKINCKGEVGDYRLQQCDLNYRLTEMDVAITDYFMSKTKELKDWNLGKDENGLIVNSHKFYSFRIVNGVLTEILPK